MNLFSCPLLTLLLLVPSAQAGSDLKIAPPVLDLGTIVGGPPLAARFELHNQAAQDLEIVEVNRSCGCLAPRLERLRLPPGEKTTLHMDLRTLGHQDGPHAWNAQIVYRLDGATHQQPLTVKAVVRNEIVLQPAALAMHVADALTQEVRLEDRRETPLSVRAASTSWKSVRVEVKADRAGAYRLFVHARAADLPPGRSDGFLDIYTDDAKYAHVQVPLTLTRVERSDIIVTPQSVRLRPGEASAPLRLRSRSDKALALEKLETGDPGLTCTWAIAADGSAAARVRASADMAAGAHEVRVHLAEPARQIVRIAVQVVP